MKSYAYLEHVFRVEAEGHIHKLLGVLEDAHHLHRVQQVAFAKHLGRFMW